MAFPHLREVKNPTRTYPFALILSIFLVAASYMFPLLAAVGMIGQVAGVPSSDVWKDGTLVTIAQAAGGATMKGLVTFSSLCSNMALFSTELFVDSYLLLGMAEQGLVPRCFAKISRRFRAPYVAIICNVAIMVTAMWFLNFEGLMVVNNAFSGASILLEIVAAVYMRSHHSDMRRPYTPPCSSSIASYVTFLALPPVLVICILIGGTLLAQRDSLLA